MILMTIFILAVLSFLFWLGFKITGALLSALIWMCIKLPIGLCLWALGLAFCVTILLIPVGTKLMHAGTDMIF